MKNKLTAKEYLQDKEFAKVGGEKVAPIGMVEQLLEDFAALKVKEEKEDSETFEGWAVYENNKVYIGSVTDIKDFKKLDFYTNLSKSLGGEPTIQPITVTVKKKN